ncbi:lysophospholipase L1-like esterase [Algoriphagus iocasae]|uniref:Lysophospholipase L1-like esterase n=1 Tax=Algoriphagus iocasae TaxID=1836499 RepID=A0A841MMX0_9BACT|nr:SGNH/GDSL hydrolase family protein [Algoriphagus iocasae]MBB6325566.1 lysophospholipase L1-like esterase [Algoriphagus iocasae]
MLKSYLLSILIFGIFACNQGTKDPNAPQPTMSKKETKHYLALGDSYTIGEGVAEADRYPNQLVDLLNAQNESLWAEPKIIAKTGWTVDELEEGINKETLENEPYDLVTLSIGVNNQYRGRDVEEYEIEFEKMLLRAMGFAGNLPDHVYVLSIPDWGITPFASENNKDAVQVAKEIDAYNAAKKEICDRYGVTYIDITEEYRAIGAQEEMLVEDQLHPSGKIYASWAQKLKEAINPE